MFALASAPLLRALGKAGWQGPPLLLPSWVNGACARQAGAESNPGFAPGKAGRRLAPAGELVLETRRSAGSFPGFTQEEEFESPLRFTALKTPNPAAFLPG